MKKAIEFMRKNPWFDFLLALWVAQVAILACKMLGVIEWRWCWVLAPTWGLAFICVVLVVLLVICAASVNDCDWTDGTGGSE